MRNANYGMLKLWWSATPTTDFRLRQKCIMPKQLGGSSPTPESSISCPSSFVLVVAANTKEIKECGITVLKTAERKGKQRSNSSCNAARNEREEMSMHVEMDKRKEKRKKLSPRR